MGSADATAAKVKPRPDLVVRAVSAPPSAAAGSVVVLEDATVNRGRRKAGRSVTRFYLSTDRTKGKDDVLLPASRSVGALAPRKTSKGKTSVTVPAPASGPSFVIACADDRRKVRESKERNNCRAAASPMSVASAALVAGPLPPATAVPSSSPAPSPTAAPTPSPTVSPTPQPTPGPGTGPALPASVLTQVAAVVDAPSLAQGLEPTKTLLRSAGIELTSAPQVPPATEPAGGIVLPPDALAQVVIEARKRSDSSRVSFAVFAETLAAAHQGFDLERGLDADTSPALAMREWLVAAVHTALEHPDEEISVPLLQLVGLARAQNPPVEITHPHFDPEELNLGSLDLLLLSSAIAQMVAGSRADQPAPATAARTRAAATTDKCSWVKNTLEEAVPFAGDIFGYASGKVAGEGLGAIYESFGRVLFGADEGVSKERTGKALSVLGLLMKLHALALLYDSVDLELTAPQNHDKPNPGITTLPTFSVTAKGGVGDADWEAYKAGRSDDNIAELKDCAAAMGLPLPTTLADLGGQVEKWRIFWTAWSGPINLARGEADTMDFKGLQAEYLRPVDDHSGVEEANFEIQNAAEPLGSGPYAYDLGIVKGELKTDTPLTLSTLFAAADGGEDPWSLAAAIADVAAGWFQNMRTIDHTVPVLLRYQVNEGLEWTGTIETTYTELYERNRTGVTSNGTRFANLRKVRKLAQYRGVLGKSPDVSATVGVSWSANAELQGTAYEETYYPLEGCPEYTIDRTVEQGKGTAALHSSESDPLPLHTGGLEWRIPTPYLAEWSGESTIDSRAQSHYSATGRCVQTTGSDTNSFPPEGWDYFETDKTQPGADNRWRGRKEEVTNRQDEDDPTEISVRSVTYSWDIRRKP